MAGRSSPQALSNRVRPCVTRTCDKARRDITVEIRLPLGVKVALERAAEADIRSVGALTEKILSGWLRKNGHLAAE